MELLMTEINKGPEISKRQTIARRQFLRFLAGSPLLTATSASIATLLASSHQALAQSYDALRGAEVAVGADGVITAPSQATTIMRQVGALNISKITRDNVTRS
jgi:hypothetical protein